MRIALIADTFPPMRTSGAVQLRDLSRELIRQGHSVTVILPDATLNCAWTLGAVDGADVLRLRAPKTKDLGYVRRTLCECALPIAMLWNLRKSPYWRQRWDGVIWYAPTIFLGLVADRLKRVSRCRGYLIVRDIFPEWALDMGLMRQGLTYQFFRAVARYQYAVADTIGVQSPGNLVYFRHSSRTRGRSVEVLQNWLGQEPHQACAVRIDRTPLAGRTIFVYAGNMGVAQGLEIFLELADAMQDRRDVGFLFVGRGTQAIRLASEAQIRGLRNVLFHDEIEPEEIPGLYAQCHIGLVALDPRHKTHNIPGKFLTYMRSGLPVLAAINSGNDLAGIISGARVGMATESRSVPELRQAAIDLIATLNDDDEIRARCCALFSRMFSPDVVVGQIVSALCDSRPRPSFPVAGGSRNESPDQFTVVRKLGEPCSTLEPHGPTGQLKSARR